MHFQSAQFVLYRLLSLHGFTFNCAFGILLTYMFPISDARWCQRLLCDLYLLNCYLKNSLSFWKITLELQKLCFKVNRWIYVFVIFARICSLAKGFLHRALTQERTRAPGPGSPTSERAWIQWPLFYLLLDI